MGYCVTTPEREKVRQKKLTCTQKTASRKFFSYSIKTNQEKRSQAPELHQANHLTSTKIASGIPYWMGRDPLRELGGLNINSFSGNNPINDIDILGLHPHFFEEPCCAGVKYDDETSCCVDKKVKAKEQQWKKLGYDDYNDCMNKRQNSGLTGLIYSANTHLMQGYGAVLGAVGGARRGMNPLTSGAAGAVAADAISKPINNWAADSVCGKLVCPEN